MTLSMQRVPRNSAYAVNLAYDRHTTYRQTRKMVPIARRASSFLVVVCMYVNRKEEEETEQQLQSYQFTQGYITLHRLQVRHLTLNFIIHYQYNVNTLFIYIHTYILWIVLFTKPSVKMIQLA